MKTIPLYDNVLVKRETEADKTEGGLYIPETAKDKPQKGVIVAAGKGYLEDGKVIPLQVKKGDRVLFGKYSGTEIQINGELLLIMKENEILVLLEK